ncbi:MAG: hypothetical protein K5697_08895 [Lachnospiraceae bacterium]|nr:hypothetical protein [Lachnospiraceae bacterium]
MSNYTYTTTSISIAELRHLRESASRANSLQESNRILRNLAAKNDAAIAQYQSRINALNTSVRNLSTRLEQQGAAATKEVQDLRTQLQRTVRDSNARIQAMEHENEARISAMQQNFSEEIQQTREDIADAIDDNNRRIEHAMRENNEILHGEMRDLQAHVDREMDQVHAELDSMEAAIQGTQQNQDILLEMAREYARTADILLDDLQTQYRVELLCPNRLKPVLGLRDSARKEIEDAEKIPQNSATARHEARNSLEEIIRLREEVLLAEQQWELHFENTRQVVSAADSQIETSRELPVPGAEEVCVDVDLWTSGDLSALERRVGELSAQLANPQGLSMQDLDEIQAAGLQVSREIDEAVVFAFEAAFSSQGRSEIAADIMELLQKYGLELVSHSFQGDDLRAAHRAHFRNNRTGLEIVITQTPYVKEDGSIENQLDWDVVAGHVAENHDIAAQILEAMHTDLGIQMGAVTCHRDYESKPSDRIHDVTLEQWRGEQQVETIRPACVSAPSGARKAADREQRAV